MNDARAIKILWQAHPPARQGPSLVRRSVRQVHSKTVARLHAELQLATANEVATAAQVARPAGRVHARVRTDVARACGVEYPK